MSSKEYFDDVAEKWDRMRAAFFSETVREKAFAAARISPGNIAADIGAGTGFIAEGLTVAGLRVIAVDQSAAMLEEIKQKLPAVECRLGTADRLPLQDNAVDHAFANMYLHHVPDPLAAIREMTRIVKERGTVVVTDLDSHDFQFLRTEQHDVWMGFARSEVAKWMAEAGLTDVRIECTGERCFGSSLDGSCNGAVSIFVASGKKQTSDDSTGRKAREYFESGYLCAESVLLAVTENMGIKNDLIPRIATGFCGGMARTSGLCGALTGGILALNVLFGRDRPGDSRIKNYALVARFIKDFEESLGATDCTGLLGCDIGTEEGARAFREKGLMASICKQVTGKAADLVMELIRNRESVTHPLDLK